MNTLVNLVVVLQVISALVVIGLVLLQHGKGADMGAAFGSGASGSLFGASGSSNFMSKSTGVFAAIFFGCTLALASFAKQGEITTDSGVMDRTTVPVAPPAPVTGPAAIPQTAPATPVEAAPAAPVEAAPAAVTPATVPAPASPAGQVPK
ncbi:MAG: preprotein translocase subunit SecG [Pseudomonadota bacterium]